jgi:hypothetical protein
MNNNIPRMTKKEYEEFFKTTADLAALNKIVSDGFHYVDDSEFWKWMIDIHKNGKYIGVVKTGTDAAEWLNLHEVQTRGIKTVIQTRGFEWDIFSNHRSSVLDLNKLPKYNSDIVTNKIGTDVVYRNILTGQNGVIECKAALSESGIRSCAKKLFNYEPNTKFAVNESVYDSAVKMGMPKERFIKIVPDSKIQSIADNRYEEAIKGNIDIGVTLSGSLKQIGNGALIGAVVSVGMSSIVNFSKYKKGEISGTDYANILLQDSLKGGLTGGSMAAINIPVQLAAKAIGVGMPVTLPVMIIVGFGLRKIIDPIFGEGDYKNIINEMVYTNDITRGFTIFAENSHRAIEMQKPFLEEMMKEEMKGKILNKISRETDKRIEEAIKEI